MGNAVNVPLDQSFMLDDARTSENSSDSGVSDSLISPASSITSFPRANLKKAGLSATAISFNPLFTAPSTPPAANFENFGHDGLALEDIEYYSDEARFDNNGIINNFGYPNYSYMSQDYGYNIPTLTAAPRARSLIVLCLLCLR